MNHKDPPSLFVQLNNTPFKQQTLACSELYASQEQRCTGDKSHGLAPSCLIWAIIRLIRVLVPYWAMKLLHIKDATS